MLKGKWARQILKVSAARRFCAESSLVNLVKDTVSRLPPQTTSDGFPTVISVRRVHVSASGSLVRDKTCMSIMQLPSHTALSHQPTLPCVRGSGSFRPGTGSDSEPKSGLPGHHGASVPPLFLHLCFLSNPQPSCCQAIVLSSSLPTMFVTLFPK